MVPAIDPPLLFRLIRAGFRSGTIIKVLKNYGAEEEILSGLEEEASAPEGR